MNPPAPVTKTVPRIQNLFPGIVRPGTRRENNPQWGKTGWVSPATNATGRGTARLHIGINALAGTRARRNHVRDNRECMSANP